MATGTRRGRSGGPLVVARLSSTPVERPSTVIPPWPGRQVTAAGAPVYVRSTPPTGPDPEPALYVHGLAGASTNWTDFAATLSPWLDGEAIDLPGFGKAGASPQRMYSIASNAAVVIDYIERRGRGPVHLFGNSMGGAISIRVAARRPDLVRTLTLISPAVPDLRPRRPGPDMAMVLLLVPGAGSVARRRLDALTPHQRARGTIELCFAHPSRVPPQRLAEAVADVQARNELPWAMEAFTRSLRGIVADYVAPGRRSPFAAMRTISAPTLVVWGQQDRLVDVSLAPRVARAIPDARLLVLPDVGHVAQLEDSVTTARAFLGLLEDVRARTDAIQNGSDRPLDLTPGSQPTA
ncbi:MAG: alpha/beta hydrolase [bacterium]